MTGATLGPQHLLFLLQGAGWTLALSLVALLGGGLLGFALALCRVSPLRAVRAGTGLLVQAVQGTPLLVLMFLAFFGLPALGLRPTPFQAAGGALVVFAAAYLAEIWRGCIEAVPRGQWEAAEGLGLTRAQRMRLVVLPQAARIAAPPTVGFLVQIVKNTSLASVVGFVELMRAGQVLNNALFQPFALYALVALGYFALCWPLSLWSRRLEARRGGARLATAP